MQALQLDAEKEARDEEATTKKQFQNELEQAIKEKKSRQAAELQARPDLTKEQMDAVSN